MANKKIENAPYKLLDCLSTSALKSLLKQDLNDSEDELSVETIKYIVHLLDERSREIVAEEKETDVDSAWKQFIRDGIPLVESEEDLSSLIECAAVLKEDHSQVRSKKKQILKPAIHFMARKIGVIAATICILFTIMILAQAVGIDVFGAIARWTDETFHFDVYDESELYTNENGGYTDKLGDILDNHSLSRELAPTWYPAGYTMSDIEVHQEDGNLQIFYSCDNGEGNYFSVQVLNYEDVDELSSYIIEKSGEDVETLKSHGKQFYLLTNEDTITATWSDGHILESISGNLSKEDLLQIIKSIGGN